MREFERIREEVVRTSEAPWLEEFFHGYSLKKEAYAYCLYVEQDKGRELVRGLLFTPREEPPTGPLDGFVEYLMRIEPKGFMDVMFALDTYNYLCPDVFGFRTEEPEPQLGPGMSGVIEPLLSDSRGFIVWHYQLEHICGLFHGSVEFCRQIRKGFGAKHPSARAWMEQREVEDDLSLYCFILLRTMIGGTMVPSLEGAFTLFRALDGRLAATALTLGR